MSERADELLARWAAAKLGVPRDDVEAVAFRHEDGWSDEDSGTYWPKENYAVVTLRDRRKQSEIAIDGIEGLTGFIREVLTHDLSQEHDPDSQGGTPPPRRVEAACERPHHNAQAELSDPLAAGTGRELR